MARVAVGYVISILFLLCFQLIFIQISQQTNVLDYAGVASLHLRYDSYLQLRYLRLVRDTYSETGKLTFELIQGLERFNELFVDFWGISWYNFDWTFNIHYFPDTIRAQNCVLFIGRAEHASDMASSDFMELKGDSDGVGSDIVGRNDIIGCVFPELDFDSLIVKIVDD